jgi:hypothetical protein
MEILNKSKTQNEIAKEEEKPKLKGDYGNLLLLFLFYVLQGKIKL